MDPPAPAQPPTAGKPEATPRPCPAFLATALSADDWNLMPAALQDRLLHNKERIFTEVKAQERHTFESAVDSKVQDAREQERLSNNATAALQTKLEAAAQKRLELDEQAAAAAKEHSDVAEQLRQQRELGTAAAKARADTEKAAAHQKRTFLSPASPGVLPPPPPPPGPPPPMPQQQQQSPMLPNHQHGHRAPPSATSSDGGRNQTPPQYRHAAGEAVYHTPPTGVSPGGHQPPASYSHMARGPPGTVRQADRDAVAAAHATAKAAEASTKEEEEQQDVDMTEASDGHEEHDNVEDISHQYAAGAHTNDPPALDEDQRAETAARQLGEELPSPRPVR
eukprot:g7155.t1